MIISYGEGSQGCQPSSPVMRDTYIFFKPLSLFMVNSNYVIVRKYLSPNKGVEYGFI